MAAAVTTEEIIQGGTKLYQVLRDTKVERALANAQSFTNHPFYGSQRLDGDYFLPTTFPK